MKLKWQRTVIGGRTAPYDFAAYDGEIGVGRIYRTGTVHSGLRWFWAMNGWGPGITRDGILCNGLAATKAEAVRLVEDTYARCLAKVLLTSNR
jgi:hypothetical protein